MTATPRPDEELMPLDGCSDPLELEALEVSEAEELVAAELDDGADVPGIVAALTAPKMPTPATAAMEALTVSRWIRLSAWSRAQALA